MLELLGELSIDEIAALIRAITAKRPEEPVENSRGNYQPPRQDWPLALPSLAARLHEGLAMSARLAGELMPAANVTNIANIVLSPDYQKLRQQLLVVLR